MDRRTFLAGVSLPWLARDGMLAPGGQRRFIVGTYSPPKVAEPWWELGDAGFNLAHARNPEALAGLRAHGLGGWIAVGSITPGKEQASRERIRKLVLAARGDPALLFWETEDEPSYQWKNPAPRIAPEQIIATYRFLKSLDAEHPVYLNHAPVNLVSTLRRYNPGADIVGTDIYPVAPHGIREMFALWPDGRQGDFLNPYPSQVGRYADKMREVAGPARAVFLVLQAFAWEDLRKNGKDPAMVLYPTRGQIRFMTYQAIVHGVNGVIYYGLSSNPPGAPVWEDLKAVTRELRSLAAELAAPALALNVSREYHDTGHSLDTGIELAAKPAAGGAVLIAVNADPNPVEATLAGLGRYRGCEVLFERRRPEWNGGSLRDRFEPFTARVYRLSA